MEGGNPNCLTFLASVTAKKCKKCTLPVYEIAFFSIRKIPGFSEVSDTISSIRKFYQLQYIFQQIFMFKYVKQ